MLSTPRTTSEHPRVPIRTKKLLRHTREDTTVGVHGPQHHHNGHELHLGQKPKLGGRYTNITLIYISYSIGSLYIHVSFSFFLLLFLFCSYFPKHKRPKIFFVVPLRLFLWFFVFGLFNLLVSLLSENPKRFCFVCYLPLFLPFRKSKTQKYFVFFFGFVKFVAEFSGPRLLHWSLVITLYHSSHKRRAFMTIYTT